MKTVVYVIDYYDHDGSLGDCYPDFLATRSEAEAIAPVFMREPTMEWAGSYKIEPHEIDDE
jgi:hypothetical protein